MADQNMTQALAAYDLLCRMLDANEWNYSKREEELIVESGAKGDDLPIDILIKVDPKMLIVKLVSRIPFVTPEDKRVELSVAINVINSLIVDGCFDYDISSGNIFYRQTVAFNGTVLSEEALGYLLYCACHTIDEYNDKLLLLGKGTINLEQFMTSVKN